MKLYTSVNPTNAEGSGFKCSRSQNIVVRSAVIIKCCGNAVTCKHSIHHGLESTDQVEASAAIYATHCLCEHSAIFAAGVYDKIATMIQGTWTNSQVEGMCSSSIDYDPTLTVGLTTPVEKKLDLIPILDLMHHDTETVTQVRYIEEVIFTYTQCYMYLKCSRFATFVSDCCSPTRLFHWSLPSSRHWPPSHYTH